MMAIKSVLRKSSFFFCSLLALTLTFFTCWLVSFIIVNISNPLVLQKDILSYILTKGIIFFSIWGPVVFFTFLIYYFSIYYSFLNSFDKSKIGKGPLFISLLFACLLFQVKETALPYFEYKNIAAQYQYQYALVFFNKGVNLFEQTKKNESKSTQALFVNKALFNLRHYQSYDKQLWIDSQSTLYNRGFEANRAGVATDRNPSNSLTTIEMINLLEASINTTTEPSSLEVKRTPQSLTVAQKYNEIDRANMLMEEGKKQNQLEKLLTAYILFAQYSNLDKQDIELRKGKANAMKEMEKLSFFREDVIPLFEFPIVKDLLILQKRKSSVVENKIVNEEITAEAMVLHMGIPTFKNINIHGFSNDKKHLYDIKADFAQIRGDMIQFSSLSDRISSSEDVHSGKLYLPGHKKYKSINSIDFTVSKRLLPLLDRSANWKRKLGLYQIFSLLKYFAKEDPRKKFLFIDLIRRVSNFGLLLFFPIFLTLISARLKPIEKERPWWLIALFPFIAGATFIVYQLISYYISLFISFFVLATNEVIAIILVSAIILFQILLGITLFLIRSQRRTL